MQAIGLRSTVQHGLISMFILLNVATVFFMNRPLWLSQRASHLLSTSLSPMGAYRVRFCGWLMMWYAHVTGLDNRWQMFSHNSRFNWWYVINARYADSTTVVLPLPRQSPRTFWQRTLFDHKEAKFHLNIYGDPSARERYARYLCRQYPVHEGSPITGIIWELHHQMILNPKEAAVRGTHLEPNSYGRVLNTFPCPGHGPRS